jgi:hypothetical protein
LPSWPDTSQKDDPGSLTVAGFSAGARSKIEFGWARNIEKRRGEIETLSELARDTAAAFALFWNLCQSWLPSEIIQDINNFIAKEELPPMDPAGPTPAQDGAYRVMIEDTSFDFSDVRLTPPMGVMASNYAR